jgi:hypothetical protein
MPPISLPPQVFTVSGATAQWYFAPAGAAVQGAVMRSVRHALGPSFGSLCLSSIILVVISYIRCVGAGVRLPARCTTVMCFRIAVSEQYHPCGDIVHQVRGCRCEAARKVYYGNVLCDLGSGAVT